MDFKKDIYQDPEIKKYLKQMAQDQRAFVSLANILFTRGLVEDAVEVCKDGLEKNPNFAAGRAVLGKCYHKLGNKENARVEFENTLKINPENVVALKGLGEIYYGLQIFDKSLDMYKRLLFIDPMNDDFKSMIEKTEKALDTQVKLREERLERLKQQNGVTTETVVPPVLGNEHVPMSEPESVSETNVSSDTINEDETYQTSFPRTEQPVEESLITPVVPENETYSAPTQQFSQADIDQLIGAAVVPSFQNQKQEAETQTHRSSGLLEKIEIVTNTLIDLYRIAGRNDDAEYLAAKLSGTSYGATSDTSVVEPSLVDDVTRNADASMSITPMQETIPVAETEMFQDSTTDYVTPQPEAGQEQLANNFPITSKIQESPTAATSDLDDILGSVSTTEDIDALLSRVVPQQTVTAELPDQSQSRIVTEDVLNKEDVSAFEITGAENIRWRQGDDADIEKTIEQSDGILTNDSAAMQMFTQEVNESRADEMLQSVDSVTNNLLSNTTGIDDVSVLQDSSELLPITDAMPDSISEETVEEIVPNGSEDVIQEGSVFSTGTANSTSTDEVVTLNETIVKSEINETLTFDDISAASVPSSQNDPFSLDGSVIAQTTQTENLSIAQSAEETVDEIMDMGNATPTDFPDSIPEPVESDMLSVPSSIEEHIDSQETLTTDENFVPEYRQDAFYSIEDAAQSLTDLQSLMAATEETFPEPVAGEELTVTSSSDDIMDELSSDEALSKEKAAAMDFTGASDVMITPNQTEDISQTELQKFASREELDMTDMLTEQNSIGQEVSKFEGKNELEMEEIQITATAHVSPSDEKNIISEEIEETIDGDMNTATSFSGKNEVSLGDVSLASQGAPQQSKELNPDTLLLPGMEQKKDSVNIDEFLNDAEKKDDMDDINNWLKGL